MSGRRPSPLVVAAVLAVLGLVALLAYGLAQTTPETSIDKALARGERKPAPSFELQRLSGSGRRSLADFRGRVVVLNFWASWCPPCRRESPLLQRWQKRISVKGRATVLGIDSLDVTSDARKFVADYGLTYPMLEDRSGAVAARYGTIGYPETFVIDRDGRIAARRRGPVDEAFMRAAVLPLVSRDPSY